MNLIFFGDYKKSGVGTAPSSPPTITIYSVNRTSGAEASVVSGGTTTASALTGRYFYQLTSANLQTYDYHARFHTSDSTVDQQDQDALWTRWSEAVATDSSGDVTLSGVTFPSNFASTSIDSSGRVLLQAAQAGVTIPTVTTTTNLANLPAVPTDWLTAAGVNASAVTKIQTGLDPWTRTLPGSYPSGSAGNILGNATVGYYDGVTQAGATSTTLVLDGDTGPDVLYRSIVILDGTGADQSRVINAYDSSTFTAAFDRAWAVIPPTGSRYALGMTTSGYILAGGPVATLPTGTVAAGSTGSAVIVSGLLAGKSFTGQRLYHYPSGESRTIADQSYASGNYTFIFTGSAGTEAGPFSTVATNDLVSPVP